MSEEPNQEVSIFRNFFKSSFITGLLLGMALGTGGGMFAGKNLFSGQLDTKKFDELLTSVNERIISPFAKREQMQKEPNIAGDWIYSASSDKYFKEGLCHERSGTTHISRGAAYEYNVHGERKQRTECEENAKRKIINWDSEYAPLIITRNKIMVWFHTNDDPQSLGLMLLDISSNSDGVAEKLSGPMFYLEDSNKGKNEDGKNIDNEKTWIRANIVFYKEGTEPASQLKSSWR